MASAPKATKLDALHASSLENFGVAGLLGESSEIFYESLYSLRHIGRVSDLIAARLRGAGPSELRLRTVLLFSAFEGGRAKMLEVDRPFEEPVLVECGIDGERIAIGVSFATGGTWILTLEGLAERVAVGTPLDEIERQIAQIARVADRAVLKLSLDGKRVELAAIFSLRREALSTASPELLVARVDPQSRARAPQPRSYTELGDLDHPVLLKPDGRGDAASPETLIAADRTPAPAELERIPSEEREKPEIVKIPGGAAEALAEPDVIADYQERIHELESRLASLESSGPDYGRGGGFSGFSLKKLWPFKKAPADAKESAEMPGPDTYSDEPELEVESESDELETVADGPKLRDADEVIHEAQLTLVEPEEHAKRLADEINEGEFNRVVKRATKESADIKKLVQNEAAKRWIDGLLEGILREKARVYEMSLALGANLRKKELDFKVQEQKLLSELRARDTVIRKKNSLLAQARDKLAKNLDQLEVLKSGAQVGRDDAQLKQRYAMVQKLLAASKKDNADLLAKMIELKGQLGKNRGPSPADFMALKSKNERYLKQLEELKRENQGYVERLGAAQSTGPAAAAAALADAKKTRGPIGPVGEEMRKKLELATRMATKAQGIADQLTLKVEEQENELVRVRRELIRAQNDLKRKIAIGGDTGSPPPAAA